MGIWVLGIYGVTDATYLIQYVQYNDCPNQCSNHGDCMPTGCNCSPGYTGGVCETKTNPLMDGEVATGLVIDSSWNYFAFNPRSTTDLLVTLTQGPGYGQDWDLYVRRVSKPTLTQYDARNITVATVTTIRITQPAQIQWNIGVFGFQYCSYSISAISTNGCGWCQHGTCKSEGVCECTPGWAGDACDTLITPITNFSAPIMGQGYANKWTYYNIQGRPDRFLRVTILELESSGALWLYLLQKTPPTIQYHNPALTDTSTNTNTHMLATNTVNLDMWYVGVYGSPFSTDPLRAFPFRLEAWESPF